MTQKQLAEKIESSQQQIQRIEVGQYAKLDLAVKICAALNSDLEEIFPSTKKAIKALKKKKIQQPCKEADDAMEEAGIDVDPVDWTIKYRFKNGLEGFWEFSSNDKDRLIGRMQLAQSGFFCATSRNVEIAINISELSHIHPCWDYGRICPEPEADESAVKVYLCNSLAPLSFEVEPDVEETESEDSFMEGEFRSVLYDLEMGDEEISDTFFSFSDIDGEVAFFRRDHVVMLEIPLSITHPELEDCEDGIQSPDETTELRP